jgi:hypothetical protein
MGQCGEDSKGNAAEHRGQVTSGATTVHGVILSGVFSCWASAGDWDRYVGDDLAVSCYYSWAASPSAYNAPSS